MSLEVLSTAAAVGTFIVIAATAVAAIFQLAHLRASNQLSALVGIGSIFFNREMMRALDALRIQLPNKVQDPDFRRMLEVGPVKIEENPELAILVWTEMIGVFLKRGIVSEDVLLDWNGTVYLSWWAACAGTIAVLRRRNPSAYENFEYLASRAKRRYAQRPRGSFPAGTERMPLSDPWLATDHAGEASAVGAGTRSG